MQPRHLVWRQEALARVLGVKQRNLTRRVARHPGQLPLDGQVVDVAHEDDAAVRRSTRSARIQVLLVEVLHVFDADFAQAFVAQGRQQVVAQDAFVG